MKHYSDWLLSATSCNSFNEFETNIKMNQRKRSKFLPKEGWKFDHWLPVALPLSRRFQDTYNGNRERGIPRIAARFNRQIKSIHWQRRCPTCWCSPYVNLSHNAKHPVILPKGSNSEEGNHHERMGMTLNEIWSLWIWVLEGRLCYVGSPIACAMQKNMRCNCGGKDVWYSWGPDRMLSTFHILRCGSFWSLHD